MIPFNRNHCVKEHDGHRVARSGRVFRGREQAWGLAWLPGVGVALTAQGALLHLPESFHCREIKVHFAESHSLLTPV